MTGRDFLVLGADGQVGYELVRQLCVHGRVVPVTRSECDLSDLAAVRRLLAAHPRAMLFNAAAYTAVDRAEHDVVSAALLNEELPGMLAEDARARGNLLVHFSTDYVFDGANDAGYREEDAVAPLNVYGTTKLAGERRVQESGAHHLIVRTSWVYGLRGRNFLRTILDAARHRPELRVVDDQRGAPTWSRLVASAAAGMALGWSAERAGEQDGVYHVSAGGATTWHGFAERIVGLARRREALACERVVPIDSSELGAPARRPRSSLLSNAKVERTFGIVLPMWEEQLELAMAP